MIENVVQLPLAVGEDLVIQKNRIGSGGKRLCVVTGTHGDELARWYIDLLFLRRFLIGFLVYFLRSFFFLLFSLRFFLIFLLLFLKCL